MIVADSETGTSDDTGKEDPFSSPSVSPTPAPTEVPAGSQVALTFEDGPDIYTERLLNALEEQDAKATFFVVGDAASDFPDTINRILNTGNELGNHTYSHETLTKLDSSEIPYQINDLNQVIEQLTGTSTDLLRPPYGAVNETVQENSDFPIILWSLDSGDKDTSEIGDIVQKVLENVKDGDIIRMHDTHETSVAAAEVLITELKNRGFELVTVSELARSKGIDLKAGEIYKNF
ncbi:MAG TPA: polysaccharide deacetylase family protein [Candidatus Blautia intestinigallinarum]|nr:polysaccharide deacetylase family protein [Candidatus Blautia intestinigallinarum]